MNCKFSTWMGKIKKTWSVKATITISYYIKYLSKWALKHAHTQRNPRTELPITRHEFGNKVSANKISGLPPGECLLALQCLTNTRAQRYDGHTTGGGGGADGRMWRGGWQGGNVKWFQNISSDSRPICCRCQTFVSAKSCSEIKKVYNNFQQCL